MKQQMTSEKQMSVLWHISTEFPQLLQRTMIPLWVFFSVLISNSLVLFSAASCLNAFPTLMLSQRIHLFIFRTTSQPVTRALSENPFNWKQTH